MASYSFYRLLERQERGKKSLRLCAGFLLVRYLWSGDGAPSFPGLCSHLAFTVCSDVTRIAMWLELRTAGWGAESKSYHRRLITCDCSTGKRCDCINGAWYAIEITQLILERKREKKGQGAPHLPRQCPVICFYWLCNTRWKIQFILVLHCSLWSEKIHLEQGNEIFVPCYTICKKLNYIIFWNYFWSSVCDWHASPQLWV